MKMQKHVAKLLRRLRQGYPDVKKGMKTTQKVSKMELILRMRETESNSPPQLTSFLDAELTRLLGEMKQN